ncbi:unnamed protein product [Darwinula stevensoni]|uniref:Reelin n=1 Tax=Darwinula stevensoni TaxID=69355 RepID=A0A7R9A235_9CRUS|nr:unnamed protein product [Darwinula stevensoni]CAG0879039.1 unnamed protein product [Darwinula stevensoni]
MRTPSNPVYAAGSSCSPPLSIMELSTARTGREVDVFAKDGHPDPGGKLRVRIGSWCPIAMAGSRLLESQDLDLSSARYMGFSLKSACDFHALTSPVARENNVFLQFSIDGGITWTLFKEFPYDELRGERRYYFGLDQEDWMRTNASRFRFWQPRNSGLGHGSWALDSVIIGGSAVLPDLFFDDFQHPQLSRKSWLHLSGSHFSSRSNSSTDAFLSFGNANESGLESAETRDLHIFPGYLLQFEIYLESGGGKVWVEYSPDWGNRWELVVGPETAVQSRMDRHSIYHPHPWMVWRLITIPLDPVLPSRQARFRWRQAGRGWKEEGKRWGLDNVYIGPGCPGNQCGGRGLCFQGNSCLCSEDFRAGNFCASSIPRPSTFRESFQNGLKREKFSEWPRGSSEGCEGVFQGLGFCFPESNDHMILSTIPLDLTKATMVSLVLPDEARTLGVSFRFLQPGEHEWSAGDWALDHVHIGGHLVPPNSFHTQDLQPEVQSDGRIIYPEDNPDYTNEFLSMVDVKAVNGYCNESGVTLVGHEGLRAVLETSAVDVKPGWMLQFRFAIGCGWGQQWAGHHALRLEYSLDHGFTWNLIQRHCPTGGLSCKSPRTPTVYYGPFQWTLVTIILDEQQASGSTQFRWMHPGAPSSWGVKDIYIGPPCPLGCSNRGLCSVSSQRCTCSTEFYGHGCQFSDRLPTYLKEDFSIGERNQSLWEHWQGSWPGRPCHSLGTSPALLALGSKDRSVLTQPLDLRDGDFIRFIMGFGGSFSDERKPCFVSEEKDSQSVYLRYSSNGGVTWDILREINPLEFLNGPKELYFPLPEQAKALGVQFQWWQPLIDDHGQSQGFALDDVFIGGRSVNLPHLYLDFNNGIPKDHIRFHPHGKLQNEFCSRKDPVLAWDATLAEARKELTTSKVIVCADYIVQFKISVGCTQGCSLGHEVALEYRKDPMGAWRPLLSPCLPATVKGPDQHCFPSQFHSGTHYFQSSHASWTRITLPLPDETFSGETEFRFVQKTPPNAQPLIWALDDLYIGETCPHLCHGRGDCRFGSCICDPPYKEDHCKPDHHIPDSFSETFESNLNPHLWSVVRGGRLGKECGDSTSLFRGNQLYFSGCGTREAITTDLNTTHTIKLSFVLRIGSPGHRPTCSIDLRDPEESINKGVVLQVSQDNGIHWITLAYHHPSLFLQAKKVMYSLPEEALGPWVKFRWWQAFNSGPDRDQWAIDNIKLISASQQYEHMIKVSSDHGQEL